MLYSALRSLLSLTVAFAALSVLTAASAFADSPPDSMWMRAYGGPYVDVGTAVVNGPDGGFVFCGTMTTAEPGTSDVFLTHIDAWGDTIWTRTYGGPGYDVAEDLVACPDGGYLIAGFTDSYGAGNHDLYAIRTDSSGDTLWTRTYGGPGYEYGYGADLGSGEADFVIVGCTDSWGAGAMDVYLVGIDADGDTVWTRNFGMTDTEWGMAVRPTYDGGYAILGSTRSWGLGLNDFLFIKTNSSGVMVDQRTYGGSRDDDGADLRQVAGGGFVLVGGSYSWGTGGDILVIKTAADFSIDWIKNLGGDEWDTGEAVIVSSDGTYMVAGGLTDGGQMSYYAAELAWNGGLYWEGTYGGASTERAWSIVETPDLGVLMAGQSLSFGNVYQALLVRLNGKLPMIRSITDIPNDQGRKVRITWFSTVYDMPESPYDIHEYTIWRRIDQWWLAGGVRSEEEALVGSAAATAMFPVLSYPPGKWDYVATVPAMCELEYNTVVPTLCDSTIAEGMCYSAFCVMAHMSYPGYYLTSLVDSGYSVDNLAPAPPQNLYMPTENDLAWDEAPEEDFDYYTVYGSDEPDLNEASLIGYTIDPDYHLAGHSYNFYYVTATDFAGNEGDPAMVDNYYARADEGDAPAAFALRQNIPNPFGATTTVGFDLPRHTHITLEVIDIEGRVVRTLLEEHRPAGSHSATWDGRDASGTQAGPGVYFVRMTAGDFSATRKVMLLK